jgi:hypothetical protein
MPKDIFGYEYCGINATVALIDAEKVREDSLLEFENVSVGGNERIGVGGSHTRTYS